MMDNSNNSVFIKSIIDNYPVEISDEDINLLYSNLLTGKLNYMDKIIYYTLDRDDPIVLIVRDTYSQPSLLSDVSKFIGNAGQLDELISPILNRRLTYNDVCNLRFKRSFNSICDIVSVKSYLDKRTSCGKILTIEKCQQDIMKAIKRIPVGHIHQLSVGKLPFSGIICAVDSNPKSSFTVLIKRIPLMYIKEVSSGYGRSRGFMVLFVHVLLDFKRKIYYPELCTNTVSGVDLARLNWSLMIGDDYIGQR